MLQLKIWHAAGKICYGQTNFLKKKIKSWKNCKAMTTLRPLRGLRLQDKPLPWNSERQTHPGSFPGGSAGKEFAYSAGELGSIPGLRRSPGGRHGNPLQYFCLENPHGQKSLAGCSPWGHKESVMTEQVSTHMYFTGHRASQAVLVVKKSVWQCRRCKRHRFHPYVRNIPWSRKWHPTPVF